MAHYIAKYDGGDYAEKVVHGDIHTENQKAAGLTTRNQAKTFIYGFLYGGGAAKLGQIVGGSAKEGAKLKARFLKALPALNTLIQKVQQASTKGYLIGLDGRRIKVRAEYAALNTLLQSAGALICKQWLIEFDHVLKETGLCKQAQQVAWIHDEIQVEVEKGYSDEVGRIAVKSIQRAGEHFRIRCQLDGEFKVGSNWANTH